MALGSDDLEYIRAAAAALLVQMQEGVEPDEVPDDWRGWVTSMFPYSVRGGFGDHHADVWSWAWGIGLDSQPDPMVAVWARGGAKSSTAELVTAALGMRGARRYAWYVRETQDRANDSLRNIAALFEAPTVDRHYPDHAQRLVSKYGHSRGWSSTRLRTAGGYTIDAIGLDTAARGLKVEDERPDLIVLDDIDGKHDTRKTTDKKEATITASVLPSGNERTAVLAIQNLIIPDGIFSRLISRRADYLSTRRTSGPVPAIHDLEVALQAREADGPKMHQIVGGSPSWSGQDLEACQKLMDRIGLRTFLRECQHEVETSDGALWSPDMFIYDTDVPDLVRVVVGVDPSGGGDAIGIIVAGMDAKGFLWVLADGSKKGEAGVKAWTGSAIGLHDTHTADLIAAEKNFGGNMVESAIRSADGGSNVKVKLVTASRGKAVRAEPVAQLYEMERVRHAASFPALERELTTWVPGDKESPNRLDALVWAITELALQPRRRVGVYFPGMDDR